MRSPLKATSRVARIGSVIPLEAVLVGLALFVLLIVFVAADPAAHVTGSAAPFTDEGLNLVNPRNFAQLGQWSFDDWTRHYVELPFALLEAATFWLLGTGIVQARLPMILCVSLTATAITWGLRDVVGRAWAIFAGLAFGFSGLVLYYGRLVFFEDPVVLAMTIGTLVLVKEKRINLRWGLVSGLCYGIAIGTKPNAAFGVIGVLLALGLVWGWRDTSMRRWVVGSSLSIAILGLLWAVIIWLPNRAAVAIDLSTWPALDPQLTPGAFIESVRQYVVTGGDRLFKQLLGPALFLAAAGSVLALALRHRLTASQARLAVAAFAWAAGSYGILLVVTYRPNRYVVPIVPALAILAAIGFSALASWLASTIAARSAAEPSSLGAAAVDDRALDAAGTLDMRPVGVPRFVGPVIAAILIVAAVAPGLNLYRGWMSHAAYDLPAIQNQFADIVPAGTRVAGPDSTLFLMRSKAIATVTKFTNLGNLYSEGVRYYLVDQASAAPTGVPASSWAARRSLACATWAGSTTCLFQVP